MLDKHGGFIDNDHGQRAYYTCLILKRCTSDTQDLLDEQTTTRAKALHWSTQKSEVHHAPTRSIVYYWLTVNMWTDLLLVFTLHVINGWTTAMVASALKSHGALAQWVLHITHTVFHSLLSTNSSWNSSRLCYSQQNPRLSSSQLGHYSKVLLCIYSCWRSVRSTISSNAWLQEITSYKYLCTIILRH